MTTNAEKGNSRMAVTFKINNDKGQNRPWWAASNGLPMKTFPRLPYIEISRYLPNRYVTLMTLKYVILQCSCCAGKRFSRSFVFSSFNVRNDNCFQRVLFDLRCFFSTLRPIVSNALHFHHSMAPLHLLSYKGNTYKGKEKGNTYKPKNSHK